MIGDHLFLLSLPAPGNIQVIGPSRSSGYGSINMKLEALATHLDGQLLDNIFVKQPNQGEFNKVFFVTTDYVTSLLAFSEISWFH